MSQENVEMVRRWMDHLQDGRTDRVADFWDPDRDYYPVRKFPEVSPGHGTDEVERFMADGSIPGRVSSARSRTCAP